jgi:hypothetical protein
MPLEMLTIRPHPFAIIAGSSRKLRFATATTLTPIAAAHCARSMPGLAPRGATTAALLISTSTSPSSARARPAAAVSWPGSPTSAGITSAFPPSPCTWPAVWSSSSRERATSAS